MDRIKHLILLRRCLMTFESIYSRKVKQLDGVFDPGVEFTQIQHHFDLPILYREILRVRFLIRPSYKYYLGVGPNISYWFGGLGELESTELLDEEIPSLEYEVSFNESDKTSPDQLYSKP